MLIRTKLQRPNLSHHVLLRPHLIERLENGRYRKLTLVSAPVGYGKSILASLWLETCDSPAAWLSLDKNDNELNLFLSYFVAAVQTCFPDAYEQSQALLAAAETPPLDYLRATLINETSLLPQPIILVLDDFHVITEPAIHQLISALIQYGSESLHLTIVTRQDPLLELSDLRAKDQLTEIRSVDLCFSAEETRRFMEHVLGDKIDEALVDKVATHTERWPAGVHLTCLALCGQTDLDSKLAGLSGNDQYVMGYLVDEVLARQPQFIQNFLLRTAVLERFCSPLCDALRDVLQEGVVDPAESIASREIIDRLIQNNLFIIAIDQDGVWFRFHGLFAELLQHRLRREYSSSQIAALHSTACIWLEQNGEIEEAIRHALAARDYESAIQLITKHRHELLNRQQWPRLRRWLDRLPGRLRAQSAHLSMIEAWLTYELSRFDELGVQLERINGLLDGGDRSLSNNERAVLAGEANILWSIVYYVSGLGQQSLNNIRQALDVTPTSHRFARTFAQAIQIIATHLIGQSDEAYLRFHASLAEDEQHGDTYSSRLYLGLLSIELIEGNLQGVEFACKQAIRLGKLQQFRFEEVGAAMETLAYTYYMRNELAAADDTARQVLALRYRCSAEAYANGLTVVARVHQVKGETELAQTANETLMDWAHETGNKRLMILAMSEASALGLMHGQASAPVRWMTLLDENISPDCLLSRPPHLNAAWLLIADGSQSSFEQAAERLEQVRRAAEAWHNRWHMIEVFALQALLEDGQGDRTAAMVSLLKAVRLAQPSGYIRTFVDLGPPMAELLADIRETEVRPYVKQLLSSFDQPISEAVASGQNGIQLLRQPVDTLTEREIDVLTLLSKGLTDREIASHLVLSPHTVNYHLKNIYTKLDVHNRRQAEKRARALDLILTE